MKKGIVPGVLCAFLVLSACGAEKSKKSDLLFEQVEAETSSLQEENEQPAEEPSTVEEAAEGFGHLFDYMMNTLIVIGR